MIPIDVTLGLPPEVLRGLDTGSLYRDGGIIREASSGRIVALLRDSDLPGSPFESLIQCSVVPLAMNAASFAAIERRLAEIQATLVAFGSRVTAALRLANAQLEGALIGSLLGDMQACGLDLAAGRTERLPVYRHSILVDYHTLRTAVAAAARFPDVVRHHPAELRELARAALIAGVAAVDLTARLGESRAVAELSSSMAADWARVQEAIRHHLERPVARFWSRPVHHQVALELVESARRLEGHREMARPIAGAAFARAS